MTKMAAVVASSLLLLCLLLGNARAASLGRDVDVTVYLQRYGYLETADERGYQKSTSPEEYSDAIRDFQRMAGLPVTGVADQSTVAKMAQPRCGFPDKQRGGNTRYAFSGPRWPARPIKWSYPPHFTNKLPEAAQTEAMAGALQTWADVTPLQFERTSEQEADIHTLFARGIHNDGYGNAFDGPGGILAHAFQPGPGLGGDTHFDLDEAWTLGLGVGYDFKLVATHEFGHALGLAHSNNPQALMAPFYRYIQGFPLQYDDILGIETIYGGKPAHPNNPPTTKSTTPTPPTTTKAGATTGLGTTMTTTTITPRPSTTRDPSGIPWFCRPDFTVDAACNGESGYLYFFSGGSVLKVYNQQVMPGFPKAIADVFPGGPHRDVDAAVFIHQYRRTYLFKGDQVWRYTVHSLDPGYPRAWSQPGDSHFTIGAALSVDYQGHTQIFLIKDDQFWDWDWRDEQEGLVVGYPMRLDQFWLGAPHGAGAVLSHQNDFLYFFKGNEFYTLHYRQLHGRKPEPVTKWFGDACH